MTVKTDPGLLLAERAGGDTYRALGKRHGISHETARKLTIERDAEVLAALERTLILAEAARHQGRRPIWPALLIGPEVQSIRMQALDQFSYWYRRLKSRGWPIEVTTAYEPVFDEAGAQVGFATALLLTTPEEG